MINAAEGKTITERVRVCVSSCGLKNMVETLIC